jgi:hypothetical protein
MSFLLETICPTHLIASVHAFSGIPMHFVCVGVSEKKQTMLAVRLQTRGLPRAKVE